MQLILRSANSSRESGDWNSDFDVFDGDRVVGRVYQVNGPDGIWFWAVSFLLTNRKSYGHASSFDEAKAAFRTEYAKWLGETQELKER